MGKHVYVLVDKDSKTHLPKIFGQSALTRAGVLDEHIAFVGAPNELEELFTDEQWAMVLNHNWPRDKGNQWSSTEISALRMSSKFSTQLSVLASHAAGERVTKPELMTRMAASITTREEVPRELDEAFHRVLQSLT